MANVMKYWLLLESLEFPTIGPESAKPECERIQTNISKLKKSIQLSPEEIAKFLINDLHLEFLENRHKEIALDSDDESIYIAYSLFVVRKICNDNVESAVASEELISEKRKSILYACIEDIVEYGLKTNLHPSFYGRKGSIFCRKTGKKTNFYQAELMIEVFSSVMDICHLSVVRTSEEIVLCYMATIFSLLLAFDSKEYNLDKIQNVGLLSKLQRIWTDMSKATYYRNLMLLYGMLPHEKQQRIHKDMLLKLWSSGGFTALLFALLKSEKDGQPVTEVVVRLVTNPTYSARAQKSLVNQILRFLMASICNKEMMPHMGVGLISLRKLYDNNNENKNLVKDWIKQQLLPLTEIKEGRLTVMEWEEFTRMINLFFQMFCTSSFDCLPSELLVCYFPVLISCYQQIRVYGNQDVVCSHLCHLILKILNNRKKEELETIIKCVVQNSYPSDWLLKHPDVVIEESILHANDLRIVQKETDSKNDVIYSSCIHSLSTLLKESSFNTLSYQVFIILFRLVPTLELEEITHFNDTTNIDLLISDEDIQNRVLKEISERYKGKLQVIDALQTLIHHKPLKYLINENINEILNILQEILTKYTSGEENSLKLNESVITILLDLIREIVRSKLVKLDDVNNTISERLKQLEGNTRDQNLKYQISSLRNQIKSGVDKALHTSNDRFEEARSLMESHEPYRQVEGIEILIKLINEKDAFTISSVHVVTALAMNTLKSTESYTFLNCVRLFASLVYINEHQVLEILADDYLNESAGTDHRLLVGEALLRVCKELGPLCYKYKALLLNTYMCGCRSTLDEFRFSSYSNLAQICQLLTFEVHNYFEELLHLVNCELTTGKYIPAKRAAVMVLSGILAGMNNLFDYQEMLLPIYRLLKFLVSSESCDEKIRLHASIGLEHIAVKCKELLSSVNEQSTEKHIKIMGIKDDSKRNLKKSILYMN